MLNNTPHNTKYLSGTQTYNLNCQDDVLNVDTSSGTITIILPNIINNGLNFKPKRFYINDVGNNASVNNITIACLTGNTVNSAVSTLLNVNGDSAEVFQSSDTEWFVSKSSSNTSRGVQSVVAGTNIQVNNADPLNPIVSTNATKITVVANYSALPSASSVPSAFYWCSASQGTKWLPFSIGGTYYPLGLYYSNGVSWEFIEVPYQSTQAQVDAGTNTDTFVTPNTFANASKWLTKEDVANKSSSYTVSSTTTYANTKALVDGLATKQNTLGFTPENVANKTNTVVGNEASTSLYLSVKGYYDYLVGLVWLTAQLFGTWIFGLASKTTPVDADLLVISDSEDTNKAKDLSFTNLKAFLKTYFDTIYTTTTAVATQITTALTGYLTSATASATYQVILTATNFGTFITGLTAKTTIVDADLTDISDSADSSKQKKVTWLNVWTNYIKAKADVVYAPIFTILSIAKGGTNSGTTLLNNRIMQSSGGAIVEASAITSARALISDANGIPTQSVTTATELGYLSGVTSNIQTQLGNKLNLIAQSTTDGTLVSLTAVNTLSQSVLIPANTFTVGSIFQLFAVYRFTGTTALKVVRLYVNTTSTLTGATLVGTNSATIIASSLYAIWGKIFVVKSAVNTEVGGTAGNTGLTIEGLATAVSNVNIDWTVNQYLIMAIQINVADTGVVSAYKITL